MLDVARRELAADGGVSLNRIAQRAGVGIGTLYRHYPTREELVLAVYRLEIERLVDAVPALLADRAPLDALRTWTGDLVDAMRRKHGLGEALSPAAHRAITKQTYDPVLSAITTLLDAGKRAKVVRADADARDYLQFGAALWRADPDRTQPMLELILDGLTPRRR